MKHHETWEKDKEDVKWWNIMTIMRAPCPWRSPRSPWTWHRRMRSIALAPVGSWPSKQLKRFRVLVAPIFKIRIWLIIIRIFMYILYHYILWTYAYASVRNFFELPCRSTTEAAMQPRYIPLSTCCKKSRPTPSLDFGFQDFLSWEVPVISHGGVRNGVRNES